MDTQTVTNAPRLNEGRVVETKFGKLLLECISCTETDAEDGFILKLRHKTTKELTTPFGKKVQPVQHTFYMKVAEECPVGFKAEMELDNMRIVEREFIPDEPEATPRMLKWLHIN